VSARKPAHEPYQAREPRVQLLPPLVKQREKARRTRRLLAFVIVVSIAVALGGVAFGYLRASQAEASLAAERARTEQILAEQSRYAAAAQMAALVEASEAAQQTVTSNEIDWLELLTEVGHYVPAGAVIEKVSVRAPAPWEVALVPEGELRAPRVGILDLTVGSTDYALAAAFVRAIWEMDGVADVVITGATVDTGRYLTTITVTLDEQVRSGRFLESEDEGGTESENVEESEVPSPEETSAPTPTPGETTEAEE
jgi:hypothetical protein